MPRTIYLYLIICLFLSVSTSLWAFSEKKHWYGYYHGNQQVGYASIQYQRKSGKIYKQKSKYLLLQGQEEQQEVSAVLDKSFQVRSAHFSLPQKRFLVITVGKETTLQRPEKIQTFSRTDWFLHVEDFLQQAISQPLTKGKYFRSWQLSSDRKRLVRLIVRYLKTENQIHHFQVTTSELRDFWAKAKIREDGVLLSYQLGNVAVLKVAKSDALEMLKRPKAISAPFILHPQQVTRMNLLVETPSSLPRTSYQGVKKPKVVLVNPWKSSSSSPKKPLKHYLHYSFANSQQKAYFKSIARQLFSAQDSPVNKARKIGRWVDKHLRGKGSEQGQRARELLQTFHEADTLATLALCRISQIPARSAAGLVYFSGVFQYHSWVEAYLKGRWIPLWGEELGKGARFLCLVQEKTWAEVASYPNLKVTIHSIEKSNRQVELTTTPVLLTKEDSFIDPLLDFSAQRPPDWVLLPKNVWNNIVVLRSIQGKGPAIIVKVYRAKRSWKEVLSMLAQELGAKGNLEILWKQPKIINGIEGLESALRPKGSSIVYRAFIGQKEQIGILVFLVAPQKQLKELEKSFLSFITSIRLLHN